MTMTANPSVQRKFKFRAGPAGVHLFNRTTGANVLLDEIRVPFEAWAAAPRFVSIALTNACQLSCPYCYAPKTPSALDFDLLTQWLTELDENGCLGIGFGGGEPTQYRRFTEICRFASRATTMAVSFTTHGHNLNEEMLANLNGNVNYVRVSMDGIGGTYERFRGRPFDALVEKIGLVRQLAPFGINCVINAETVSDLCDAAEFAAEHGASEFLLLPERPVNGVGGIDRSTMAKLREWIESYSGSVPLSISQDGSNGVCTIDPTSSESGLRAYAHIDANGTLKSSSYEFRGMKIGAQGLMATLESLNLS